MKFLIPIFICISLFANAQTILQPNQIVYPNSSTGADKLFDGKTNTYWFPGWQGYPHKATIKFNKNVKINKLRVFDGTGRPTFTVKIKNETFVFKLDGYLSWIEIPVGNVETKELEISLTGPEGDKCIGELEIFGTVVDVIDPPVKPCDTVYIEKIKRDTIYLDKKDTIVPPPPPVPNTNDELFVGTNCFTWTPLSLLDTIGSVRAYISSQFIWTQLGLFVEPIFQSRTDDGKGLDTWLSECKRRGMDPVLCINQTPYWFNSGGSQDLDRAPVKPGLLRTNPQAYSDFASMLGQLAKRYGRTTWSNSQLRIDPTSRWTNDGPNVKKSGLNTLKWIEVWNEPDKWWKKDDGSGAWMEPEEYAAMLSISYDSIKFSDPTMKVAMAGLTSFDLDYLTRMDNWFKANRLDKKFPADAINVHQYATTQNWSEGIPVNESPEFQKVHRVVKFAKDRKLETWVSEFGYDTNPPSWVYAKPRNGKTSEQLQGEWIVETYKFLKLAGVDRAFVFTANDEGCAKSGGTFCSSGLLYGESAGANAYKPKPSYFQVLTLKALKGY